ncbi:GH25 family lysozyme [Pseudomonas massiliensis]|uniref:GH25 family lysozyme n=1 Tax=Pseudomonas massiliensis TaxID=522492 RepID=UPI000A019A1A|nr:GH25 family lysozyme [Pseudomonas massiliensis]
MREWSSDTQSVLQVLCVLQEDGEGDLDLRVGDALKVTKPEETRAIGLVISIAKYPNINADIPAADVDGKRIVNFLTGSQKFDEVIHLRNEDATKDNINWFLDTYLVSRAAAFNGKARLLIIYSGHGLYGDKDGVSGKQSAFVLSSAKSDYDPSAMYKMSELSNSLRALSHKYFHVLTLINACFGGGIFSTGEIGGNPDAFTKPGSYGIAAGDDKTVVYSLNPAQGSVFVDALIDGIASGKADTKYGTSYVVSAGDNRQITAGITRTNRLFNYITDIYADVNQRLAQGSENIRLSEPWIGSTQNDIARGGFFFLTDNPLSNSGKEIAQTFDKARDKINIGYYSVERMNVSYEPDKPPSEPKYNDEFKVPFGPVSGVPGRPEIKIFKAPDIYPIIGYDISALDGDIDWIKLKRETLPRFVYVRAISTKGRDNSFTKNMENLAKHNIDRGAYFKFNYCTSPSDQYKLITTVVPNDSQLLPPVIRIVNPEDEKGDQEICYRKDPTVVAKNVAELAKLLHGHYNKTPVISGTHYSLSKYPGDEFKPYMIWVSYWGSAKLKMGGSSPWTLWQYSGHEVVPGIGGNVEANVFFGNEAQYSEFRAGKGNVALRAVQL